MLARVGAFELQTDLRQGIERLERAHEQLPGLSGQERATLQPTIDFWIAVGYLREAMTSNCVDLRGDSGCVFASGRAGVHREPAAAEAALGHLESILRSTSPSNPLHLASKWLASVAYMATGRYPEEVPAGFAVAPAALATDEAFPRFENVAATST